MTPFFLIFCLFRVTLFESIYYILLLFDLLCCCGNCCRHSSPSIVWVSIMTSVIVGLSLSGCCFMLYINSRELSSRTIKQSHSLSISITSWQIQNRWMFCSYTILSISLLIHKFETYWWLQVRSVSFMRDTVQESKMRIRINRLIDAVNEYYSWQRNLRMPYSWEWHC